MLLTACGVPPAGPTPGPTTAVPTAPVVLGPDGVAQITHDDPARPVHLQWPIIEGADALDSAMEQDYRAREAAFLADYQPNPEAPPELNGGWEIVLDSPEWVGVRLGVYEFAGASGQQVSVVHYGRRGGTTFTASGLIAEASRGAVADAIIAAVEATGRVPLPDLGGGEKSRAALLNDLVPTAQGDLVVTVAEGALLASSEGVVSVVLPADVVAPTLSPDGRAVLDAARAAPTPPGTPAPADPAPATTAPTAAPEPSASTATSAPGSGVDCAQVACVALTFDDGPGRDTGRLLGMLAREKVPATFFVLGSSVRADPGLVRRMAAEGHEVGNHTFSHKQLTKLSAEQQRSEIQRTQDAIAAAGARATVFRPPYGSYNADTRRVAGLPLILWD